MMDMGIRLSNKTDTDTNNPHHNNTTDMEDTTGPRIMRGQVCVKAVPS